MKKDMENYIKIQNFAKENHCLTKIISCIKTNDEYRVEGTHMYSPELVHFICETLDANLNRICYQKLTETWVAIFHQISRPPWPDKE